MSSLYKHAERELDAAGYVPKTEYPVDDEEGCVEEDPNLRMRLCVLELIDVFSKQEHSGSSAPFCVALFKKLASLEPLGPLTGEDSEWMDVSDVSGGEPGQMFQNKRCGRVFKDEDGAYDINGRVFREPNGMCYTNLDSRVPVTFPYTPVTEYVDVPKSEDEDA